MKLFILFLLGLACINLVVAGGKGGKDDNGGNTPPPPPPPENPDDNDKAKKCSVQPDAHKCKAEECHWHIGHCNNTFNCTDLLTPEDCQANDICIYQEVDNGNCTAITLSCAFYDYDQCIANADTCIWTSNQSCEAVPGFVTNCAAKTFEECRVFDYCTYSSRCVNNYYPYKSWCLNKEDCQANQYSTWVVLHPAYCIDNYDFCCNLSLDECRNHTEHCAVERCYDDKNQTYSQCSDNNNPDYKEICVALQYGCQDLSIEDCQNNQFCKVIDEIGQCYPNKLVNCETLSADDCAANSHCCLKQECSDNPQIVECPAKTIEDCQASPECRVIDNGACSGQIFNCNLPKEQCLNSTNFCSWSSNISYACDNKVHCEDLEFDACWDYCEECDWHKDACKHHP